MTYTKKDFKIDWFSGTGPGGQNRNKTQNCVRITHIESGLKRTSTSHRDRKANFRDAFRALAHDIEDWLNEQALKNRKTSDEVIRTYHFVDNWVKDHLTLETCMISELEDKFGDMIVSRRKATAITKEEE